MRYKLIEVQALDEDGYELERWDYETVQKAKEAAKTRVHPKFGPDYWDRRAEVVGYHKQIYTVQLLVDGEVHSDWFPKFFVSTKKPENVESIY